MTSDTKDRRYSERLAALEKKGIRTFIDVQIPYRWNLRRMKPGYTLEIGCGIGRNLSHLAGDGVGVDHNGDSIALCRARGFVAYTSEEFAGSAHDRASSFDTLLLAHVVEHMQPREAASLVRTYLPHLKPHGRVIFITPQERGYATDATHVCFTDFEALRSICKEAGLRVLQEQSFPFPRALGKHFTYNEFVVVASASMTRS